jgi:hypothetical protein
MEINKEIELEELIERLKSIHSKYGNMPVRISPEKMNLYGRGTYVTSVDLDMELISKHLSLPKEVVLS